MKAALRTFADRTLRSTTTVYVSCAISFVLGLFFIFVWSPLPWGWQGIDFYYDMALGLARGGSFDTIHVTWGYPYFLAFWYRLFGDRPWVPLVVQASLNATIPFMLYRLARLELGPRIGVMSALVAGVLSFNTVYAATQSTDSVCTVLFVAAMWCFAEGRARRRLSLFALSGLLVSLAFQFRPNFILFPVYAGVLYLMVKPRGFEKVRQVAVFGLVFALGAAPWVVRNYLWSGLFVPASTHGGVQLWFGSLQSGPFQDNWLYNPAAAFERAPIDYSSIDELPPVVNGSTECGPPGQLRVELVYWTNRDPAPTRIPAALDDQGRFVVTLPQQPSPAALSYYAEVRSDRGGRILHATTPEAGAADPFLFVLSRDHVGDLDIAGLSLDVFDMARLARRLSWGDGPAIDLNGDGTIDERDLRLAATLLAHADNPPQAAPPEVVTGITHDEARASLTFTDGSSLSVPRKWDGRITSLDLRGALAQSLASRSRSMASLRLPLPQADTPKPVPCRVDVGINRVPYRRLPHEMRRFTALALDNISRHPVAYLAASATRAVRLFVVQGSNDKRTAAQFSGSSARYRAGRAIGLLYFALLAGGVAVAWARGYPVFMVIVPVTYVPVTIAFMLINARYSVSIQPFTFVFVAILLVDILDRLTGTPALGEQGGQTPDGRSA